MSALGYYNILIHDDTSAKLREIRWGTTHIKLNNIKGTQRFLKYIYTKLTILFCQTCECSLQDITYSSKYAMFRLTTCKY